MPRPYPREEARILALVIPVQTGIQQNLGSRFRGNDRMASSDQVLTVLIIFSGSYFVEEFQGSKMATFSTPSENPPHEGLHVGGQQRKGSRREQLNRADHQ